MNGDKDSTPLDLNNLPKEYGSKDHGNQTLLEAGSSSGHGSRKKKKDVESGKLYECRFCSLRFYKSQALGGHMNRHRQERETETLNKARMLVFSNENNMPTVHGLPAHQLGGQMSGPNGGFNHHVISDPALLFRPAFSVQSVSTRLPAIHQQHKPQPYLYPSPPRSHFMPTYPNSLYKPSNDYCIGNNVFGTTAPHTINYTCMGAAAVQLTSLSRTNGVRKNGTSTVHASMNTNGASARHIRNEDDGVSWGPRGIEETSTHQQL